MDKTPGEGVIVGGERFFVFVIEEAAKSFRSKEECLWTGKQVFSFKTTKYYYGVDASYN